MNLVTIDFDIIMWPSIEIYNDLVDGEFSVQDILDNNPNGGFIPTADLWLYKYLTDYVLEVSKKIDKDHIIFIESHEEVYTQLKDIYPAITLYNIDHHHDLGYGNNDECDCGSWAKYLLDNKKIYSYIWINDEKSIQPDEKIKFKQYPIKEYSLAGLIPETDYLVICSSPTWVPREQLALIEVWKEICK